VPEQLHHQARRPSRKSVWPTLATANGFYERSGERTLSRTSVKQANSSGRAQTTSHERPNDLRGEELPQLPFLVTSETQGRLKAEAQGRHFDLTQTPALLKSKIDNHPIEARSLRDAFQFDYPLFA